MKFCSPLHYFSKIVKGALTLGLELGITSHEVSYLLLADTLDAKFVTLDVKLKKKLKGTKYHDAVECPTES